METHQRPRDLLLVLGPGSGRHAQQIFILHWPLFLHRLLLTLFARLRPVNWLARSHLLSFALQENVTVAVHLHTEGIVADAFNQLLLLRRLVRVLC